MEISNALALAERRFRAEIPARKREILADLEGFRAQYARLGLRLSVDLALQEFERCANEIDARVVQAWMAVKEALASEVFGVSAEDADQIKRFVRDVTAESVPELEGLRRGLIARFPEIGLRSIALRHSEALTRIDVEVDIWMAGRGCARASRRVFISHINEDALLASHLKAALQTTLGADVWIFVSSDLDSIRSGDNWHEAIVSAIRESGVVVVLLSARSHCRPWINFEAGVGVGANRRVIPVTIHGLGKGEISAPLSPRHARDLSRADEAQALVRDVGVELGLEPEISEGVLDIVVRDAACPLDNEVV
jgi:hypothetical protein